MRIHTKLVYSWNGSIYILDKEEGFEYNGIVELACGATPEQQQLEGAQANFYTQATSQATQAFGAASTVFNGLMSTFAPIVAAGPNQQGFSQQELANLNSEAVTQTGQAYKTAKAAVGNQEAAYGGGNAVLPSGAQVGADLGLAEAGANQTSSELGQITQANYAQGNQNYEQAVAGEEAAPGVFSTSSGATNAATGAGSAAANTANQIAQENNSWVSAVTGALGGIAGAAVGNGGVLSKLTNNTNSNVTTGNLPPANTGGGSGGDEGEY